MIKKMSLVKMIGASLQFRNWIWRNPLMGKNLTHFTSQNEKVITIINFKIPLKIKSPTLLENRSEIPEIPFCSYPLIEKAMIPKNKIVTVRKLKIKYSSYKMNDCCKLVY